MFVSWVTRDNAVLHSASRIQIYKAFLTWVTVLGLRCLNISQFFCMLALLNQPFCSGGGAEEPTCSACARVKLCEVGWGMKEAANKPKCKGCRVNQPPERLRKSSLVSLSQALTKPIFLHTASIPTQQGLSPLILSQMHRVCRSKQ